MKKPVQHAKAAALLIQNEERTNRHDETLWFVREKRDRAAHGVAEWEKLREWASQIKDHTLSNLSEYLTAFEKNAQANGVRVHWAADAEEQNRISYSIVQQKGINGIVKSKSMLTEECGLNEFLHGQGIDTVETDVGERIVQFRNEHR